MTDHACEYLEGDPHCVVCYALEGAGGAVWTGAGAAVLLTGPAGAMLIDLEHLEHLEGGPGAGGER